MACQESKRNGTARSRRISATVTLGVTLVVLASAWPAALAKPEDPYAPNGCCHEVTGVCEVVHWTVMCGPPYIWHQGTGCYGIEACLFAGGGSEVKGGPKRFRIRALKSAQGTSRVEEDGSPSSLSSLLSLTSVSAGVRSDERRC